MNSSRNASAALSGPASGGPASGGLAVGRLSLLVDCLMLPCPRRPGFTQLTRFTIQLAAALVAASLSARERKGKQIERRSEEHTSELQSQSNLVCRLLLEKKKPTP